MTNNKPKIINTTLPFTTFSEEADSDYIISRLLSMIGGKFANGASYHAHQALEKYLKAYSIQNTSEYIVTHNLRELAKNNASSDQEFSNPALLKNLNLFHAYQELGRYGAAANIDPYATKTKDVETKGVRCWSYDHVQLLDQVIYTIRSKLNFEKVPQLDHLSAITKKDKNDMFLITWSCPMDLTMILTNQNAYFKNIL